MIWLLISYLACFHLMHGLSIFCHFWQIADHTHIFFLPLPHKLWLHMGKHSLLQECNKLQPTPRTHSRDSPMESPPMVSNPVALQWCCLVGTPVHVKVSREWYIEMGLLDTWERAVTFCVWILNMIVSNEHCKKGWLLILRSEVADG